MCCEKTRNAAHRLGTRVPRFECAHALTHKVQIIGTHEGKTIHRHVQRAVRQRHLPAQRTPSATHTHTHTHMHTFTDYPSNAVLNVSFQPLALMCLCVCLSLS
jgi:hypothetical protein